jgi:hypothetical protein
MLFFTVTVVDPRFEWPSQTHVGIFSQASKKSKPGTRLWLERDSDSPPKSKHCLDFKIDRKMSQTEICQAVRSTFVYAATDGKYYGRR